MENKYLKFKKIFNSSLKSKKVNFVDSDKFVVSHRSRGFTLVELLVGASLFIIVIGISSGVFIQSMRTQRATVALSAAVSNAQLTMEQISREIRTGQNFTLFGEDLNFTNAKNEEVVYRLNGEAIEKEIDGKTGLITAENVSVKKLNFILSGNSPDDGAPPKVTIIIRVGTKRTKIEDTFVNLQTTISSRVLDG